MKILSFIINTNIFLALAAVALSLATQVQLGMSPQFHAYLLVVFFSTLFDYNMHRFIFVYNKPEAFQIEKYKWDANNLNLLKILIISSFTGLGITLIFVRKEVLFIMAPLAFLSFLYSIPSLRRNKNRSGLLGLTSMKTLIIAFIWAAATVFIPVFQEGDTFTYSTLMLVFAERFAFIFAIAIPFDIRDTKPDALAGRKTIPIALGESAALKISNMALFVSTGIALFHYLGSNLAFIIPAYLLSMVCTFIFIHNKALKRLKFYYHGILDGCIFLVGVLIFLSYYFHF